MDTFTVTVHLQGKVHTFPCREDETVLAAAEAAGIALPCSCCTGLCTTCAALLKQGQVMQPDAMGVRNDLQEKGFTLLCVAYPRSDLQLEGGQEDALYEAQFGQYQT